MSFPTTEVINSWFQDAHAIALNAGGSVYVMEKRAEQEVVKDVLRWAYLTMLDELKELNYPTDSRVRVRVTELLGKLYMTDVVDDTEDEEFVDDYNDEEDDEENEDEEDEFTRKSGINLNTCVKGQKLKLRSGEIVSYEGPSKLGGYPHKAGSLLYTNEGKYYDDNVKDEWDIVEILPLEKEDASEEPSTEVEPALALEVINALLKALINKK
jgi:hypothetical protein